MLQKTAEETQATIEYQQKLMAAEPVEEPKMWVGFKAHLTKSQAAALRTFFIENGIDYRPIKITEEN